MEILISNLLETLKSHLTKSIKNFIDWKIQYHTAMYTQLLNNFSSNFIVHTIITPGRTSSFKIVEL